MKSNAYQLIGKDTEAILLGNRAFPNGLLLHFSEGRDSDPDDITLGGILVEVDCASKDYCVTRSAMVEFIVDSGSESETDLINAAMRQSSDLDGLLYVKHADGSVYEFSTGRFNVACRQHGFVAVFRDVRSVSPSLYEALRGPRETPIETQRALAFHYVQEFGIGLPLARQLARRSHLPA